MNNLYVLEMIETQKKQLKEEFLKNAISEGELSKNKEIDIFKDEGIALIEKTIPYIDNIYRNPNRVIINEEEIVKVELAKRVTVESVRHLSKHTNFIKSINENGEVEPSKILNINKEDSYNTYENKMIYSLIQNIKIYLRQKRESLEYILNNHNKVNDKSVKYISNTTTDGKDIAINVSMNTTLNSKGIKVRINQELLKLEKIEREIELLKESEVYKIFAKNNIRPITSPIKKTNMILKNVNFQYAVKLWEYLEQILYTKKKNNEIKEEIHKDSALKKMLDEISLLYFIAIEKDDENEQEEELNEVKKRFLNTTLDFLDLPNRELEKVLLEKVKKDKLKNSDVEKEIRKIFDKYIHEYLLNIDE